MKPHGLGPRRLCGLVATLCVAQLYLMDLNGHENRFMCLPAYVSSWHYPAQNETGLVPDLAIVYLADFRDPGRVDMLERSLALLEENFLGRFPYPVILFHEKMGKTLDNTKARLRQQVPSHRLHFREVIGFTEIPAYLNASEVLAGTRYSLGYRFMCRFWAHGVFQQPAMKKLTYYWRLDTDLFLMKPVTLDPFLYMAQHRLDYFFGATSSETPSVVVGLWGAVLRYMKLHDLDNQRLRDYMSIYGGYNMLIFWNNFEVSRTDLWRSEAYRSYFEYLDRTGGVMLRRWGDAPIRTLALAALFPQARLEQWHGLCYFHGSVKWTL